MHALVFAAGRGTRLRPYTDETPKPLLEIAGEPLLVRTLRSVIDAGVEGVVIVVGYRGAEIIETIGDDIDGVPVSYARQDERNGLARAVCTAFEDGYGTSSPLDGRPDDVLTVNGDNVFDADCALSRLLEHHREPDVDGTLLLDRVARNEAETTARCALDDDGTVHSLEASLAEEGGGSSSGPSYIAAGVQTHDARELLAACRTVDRSESGEYELADALEMLVADGARYVGIELEGWHLNVNTPADLERARRYFEAGDGP
ncbi:NTP transferase domain-containing protein [Natronorubrum sp. JWXQ-INN-674]|uniref:NTP transferase domain-containing protein n=1 Tax=Natronorubrum halalkaliphilum TaxID=2691917 RepID=A0A6B0VMQ7_9EURY|nr:sugar phosphate nucleotidyltransferase [Natronorubrum halalkaliphilum]MXV63111.1 NTP transferase domain-containing protein [Natronorubrum halalkaliphilum]